MNKRKPPLDDGESESSVPKKRKSSVDVLKFEEIFANDLVFYYAVFVFVYYLIMFINYFRQTSDSKSNTAQNTTSPGTSQIEFGSLLTDDLSISIETEDGNLSNTSETESNTNESLTTIDMETESGVEIQDGSEIQSDDNLEVLMSALKEVQPLHNFAIGGVVEKMACIRADLCIHGFGPLNASLDKALLKKLFAHFTTADDAKVLEIQSSLIEFKSDIWAKKIDELASKVAKEMGLTCRNPVVRLNKLCLYKEGSHCFKRHESAQVANATISLVLELSSSVQGGNLTIHKDGSKRVFGFGKHANSMNLKYAAFYSDLDYEISEVKKGYRVFLDYTLLEGSLEDAKVLEIVDSTLKVANALKSLCDPVAIFLDQNYSTFTGEGKNNLKGKAEKCFVFFLIHKLL